jgi:hypothetical protein
VEMRSGVSARDGERSDQQQQRAITTLARGLVEADHDLHESERRAARRQFAATHHKEHIVDRTERTERTERPERFERSASTGAAAASAARLTSKPPVFKVQHLPDPKPSISPETAKGTASGAGEGSSSSRVARQSSGTAVLRSSTGGTARATPSSGSKPSLQSILDAKRSERK